MPNTYIDMKPALGRRLRRIAVLLLLLQCEWCALNAEEAGALKNGSFTAEPLLDAWELNVYGARPKIRPDEARPAGAGRAVAISANAPSDAALGQELAVKADGYYCFSGWVRTKDLQARTATVCGTLQVQAPGGKGILASGENRQGSTDWAEVRVYFRAPANGRVRLCLFFAGFGTATGVAWFGDLKLQSVEVAAFPVRVTRDRMGSEEISPLQYGQFIEYLCNLVPGMWAEKLYDGSFEGLSSYKFEFIKETDFKEKPWYPSGEVNRAEYSLDSGASISGAVSKKIAVPQGSPCTVGISQDGIFVKKRQPCEFTGWFKAEGVRTVNARLSIHNGLRRYAECEFTPSPDWRRFSARLVPSADDANATFTIDFRGPGTLWLDHLSLMPVESVDGWRRDVVEAVRALKPGVIRFGGSALDDPNLGDFEWKDTVGPSEQRRPFRAWGGLQPVGPGLEEIVQFCRAVGAEPLICVRVRARTPKDAADEIQYFNGGIETPMGAWRARNGHPEPYHIKYWLVGNEQAGNDYEQRLVSFCRAMREADPGISLLSSFPTAGILERAGGFLDFVCPHHYSQDLVWMENDLERVAELIRPHSPGRSIKIGVTEWNTTAGDAGPRRAMLWTLANALACSRYHNLLHRHADSVKIANRSNLANSFCSGIIQTDNHRLYKTPTYYAQQLYSTLAGNRTLRIDCGLPANLGPDFSATLSRDGRTLTLFAVNDTLQPISRTIDFSLWGRKITAETWVLADRDNAGEPDAMNGFERAERIVPRRSSFRARSAQFKYAFPRLSLTVLRITPTSAF